MAEDTDETPDTPEEAGVETRAEAVEPEQAADPPAREAQSSEDPAPATVSAPVASEPEEQLSPKERRRRTRSAHSGAVRPQRAPEQRQAERSEQRAAKARARRARRSQERAKAAERRASAPAQEPLAPVHAQVKGAPKARLGTVVSDKAPKTITVRIDVARRHRRYEKIVRSSTTLHAHDENDEAHVGDLVRVVESRPLSRTKRWRLLDVLERAR